MAQFNRHFLRNMSQHTFIIWIYRENHIYVVRKWRWRFQQLLAKFSFRSLLKKLPECQWNINTYSLAYTSLPGNNFINLILIFYCDALPYAVLWKVASDQSQWITLYTKTNFNIPVASYYKRQPVGNLSLRLLKGNFHVQD